jgi:ferrous iron transport protein B
MATRTIEDDTERRITTILTPFVPYGAKLPVIALFAAVFFPGATWVFPSIYVLAGMVIIAGGLLLKKLFGYEGGNVSSFILELPEYKLPSLKHALRQMFKQAAAFVKNAATIILVMNTLVWFMQTYGWNFQPAENQGLSILASLGGFAAPLLIPLGLASWQMASSILTGFVAKENIVATLAILLAASEDALYSASGPLTTMFTPVTAFAFIAFNLFAPPCFAAVGAMNSELGGRRWIFKALLFQLGMGYMVAMLITQIGTLLVYGRPANGAVVSVIIAVVLAGLIISGMRKRSSRARETSNMMREENVL